MDTLLDTYVKDVPLERDFMRNQRLEDTTIYQLKDAIVRLYEAGHTLVEIADIYSIDSRILKGELIKIIGLPQWKIVFNRRKLLLRRRLKLKRKRQARSERMKR